jgi:phosphoribosylaminoimidazole carboxylase (NCAIR synthetase)
MQPQKFLQKRIGVLGGGQLGRMLVEAAAPLDLTVTTLDPSPDCPVSHVLPNQRCLLGDFRDAQDVKRLMADVDVLTFEIEHINVDAVEEGPSMAL